MNQENGNWKENPADVNNNCDGKIKMEGCPESPEIDPTTTHCALSENEVVSQELGDDDGDENDEYGFECAEQQAKACDPTSSNVDLRVGTDEIPFPSAEAQRKNLRSWLFPQQENEEIDYNEKLQQKLRHAVNADTKVVVGGKEFPCHMVLLQTYSKFFEVMRRPQECVFKVHLPEDVIPALHFPTLMNWILLDKPNKHRVISESNVLYLYSAGHFLGISDLVEDCWDLLSNLIQMNDPVVLTLYEEAQKLRNFKDLQRILSSKLAEMFNMLYSSRQFLSLGVDDFVVILDSDDLNVNSELDVFHAACRWLLYEWQERHVHAVRLLRCVRFGLLTSLQLNQIRHCAEATEWAHYTQIFSFPEIKDMVNDGLTYAIFRENFGKCPQELEKWLEWSKVRHPRPRKVFTSQSKELNESTDIPTVSNSAEASRRESVSYQIQNALPENCEENTESMCTFSRVQAVDSRSCLTTRSEPPSRKPPSGRQSSIRDPFTLASVLRSRMIEKGFKPQPMPDD